MRTEELTAELEHPQAQELLRSAALLRLAYSGRDDLPRVIPIGFHWTGKQVVVCTAPTAPKVRALRERPHVALTIDAGSTPADAKSLLIRGTAAVEVVDGVPRDYIAGAGKSLAGEQLEQFEAAVQGVYEQMARIAITPSWARFFDFGAGRLPRFLASLMAG